MFSRILNTFGTKALSAAINLLIAVLLSQHLGPEGKGIQSLILTTVTFILVFANLVGGATLVYLVPRHHASLLILPSYLWTLITALAAYVILLFFPLIESPFILHACILSVLNSIASVHISVMIGQEKIRAANFTGLLQPAVLIISLIVFFVAFGKASVDSYIVSLYISFSAGMLAGMLRHAKYFAGFRAHSLKEYARIANGMVRFGILNQVAHVTQMLSFRLSYYVLDHYHGASAVGVYSNGISLAESIWMISKSISMVQYARISNLEDRAESAALTARLAGVSTAMSILTILPLLLLPSGFYVLLFGEGFEGTKSVIWTLALGVVVYNFPILIGHYFSGTGRYRINALISSVGLIVSAALYFGLIPRMGLTGAGIATSVSYLFTSVIFIIWFSKEYNDWPRMFLPRKEDISALISGITNIVGDRKESGRQRS